MIPKKIQFLLILLLPFTGFAQVEISTVPTVLREQDAVNNALKNSKNATAALLNIRQQKQLLKSTFNLPNPEVFWESPTGKFYTGSITQSLEFPTVYAKQHQLQKQQVGLAETQKTLTDTQICYQVRLLYLTIQYTDSLRNQLYIQDTIYAKLASSAQRQFDAGQIDYLQKTFAETQYGEVHNQYEQSKLNYTALLNQLKYIAGIQDSIVLAPLKAAVLNAENTIYRGDSALLNQNAEYRVSRQVEAIGQKNLELQRNKALPGLAFGYFNQGERDTPTNLRFRFGLTVPLWFWQYKGNINAAHTELEVSQQRSAGLQQQLTVQLMQSGNELASNNQALTYYQTTGLKKSNEIISAAQRFLQSGEIDYISFLRDINDAYAIKLRYLETLRNVNQSILTINFLTGKQ